jgi:hypothetical protein
LDSLCDYLTYPAVAYEWNRRSTNSVSDVLKGFENRSGALYRETVELALNKYEQSLTEKIHRWERSFSSPALPGELDLLGELADILLPSLGEDEEASDLARGEEIAWTFLALAAPNDITSRDRAHRHAEGIRSLLEHSGDVLVRATQRSWRSPDSRDIYGRAVYSLTYGHRVSARIDTSAVSTDTLREPMSEIFVALTTEPSELHAKRSHSLSKRPVVPPSDIADPPLIPAEIERAIVAVYGDRGWEGLTIDAVAARARVAPSEVTRIVGDRRGLAAVAWKNARLPGLSELVDGLDSVSSVSVVCQKFLTALVSSTRTTDKNLSAAFLEGAFSWAAWKGLVDDDRRDPRVEVPIPNLLSPLLEARVEQFREGFAETGFLAYNTAAQLCNTTLLHAIARPDIEEASVVAAAICDTTLRGMLR